MKRFNPYYDVSFWNDFTSPGTTYALFVSYLWFDIKLSYMKRAVAQLVEHLVVKSQEGGGSKPPSGTLL